MAGEAEAGRRCLGRRPGQVTRRGLQRLVPGVDVGWGEERRDGDVEVLVLDEVQAGGAGMAGEQLVQSAGERFGCGVVDVEEPTGEDLAVPPVHTEGGEVRDACEAVIAAV